ncbi:tyrosine-type recombinase/integrase [Bacillus toyonensis]|uniref:tyrosine-type recombinase/integrase n=1 Tax=Bacillus toyonensis TaxID=155322 RepID=UPI002E23408B|nr:tyrosine-type recombinase/integrase [Bacillus toyonensis]MED2737471.1 tyrosine-type recombinase/integrase [Bacillus toyonensis]
MSKEFSNYIDRDGKLNFSNASGEIFLEAFKKVELFPPAKQLSEKTYDGYNKDLTSFTLFLHRENIKLKEVNVITVQDYQAYLMKQYAARSVVRKLTILKRLVSFGYKTNFYSFSMSEWIEKPKVPKYHFSSKSDQKRKEIRELDLEAAKIIINALDDVVETTRKERDMLKSRNRLLGYFLLTTGMRASEIVGLYWSDVIKKKDRLLVEFKGKGNKFRKIPLNERVVEEMFLYRKLLGYSENFLEDERPIFIAFSRNKNEQLSYDTLYKLIKKVVKRVEANKHISPHWFRHTFITSLLEQDVPLAVVKELAGHSDISTTNLYLERLNENTVEREYDKVDFGI